MTADGLFRLAELVVRAGLLIAHLVIALVGRVFSEQPLVDCDRFHRAGGG